MSKASEWAARSHEFDAPIQAAKEAFWRARPTLRLNPGEDFKIAEVMPRGALKIHLDILDPAVALLLARWILDTFGEPTDAT